MQPLSTHGPFPTELLAVTQMVEADRATILAGTSGSSLMEAAGRAVADAILAVSRNVPVTVLAGPGNNGGDGFVAARRLAREGMEVRVALLGTQDSLHGDAALAASRWEGEVVPLEPEALDGAGIVVDAVFGAGLSRPVEGSVRATLEAADEQDAYVVSVDIPSGVDGNTGEVRGCALTADMTVTFFRLKPGHILQPGRSLVGEIVLADIGIPASTLDSLGVNTFLNVPALWREALPRPRWSDHKYSRGHIVVLGGSARRSGAAKLAAHAALRAGAGLVTLAVPTGAEGAYAARLDALMLETAAAPAKFAHLLSDERITAVVIGPGSGTGAVTRRRVLAAARAGKRMVLDADALSSFAGKESELARHCAGSGGAVLTPHEGEFRRLFGSAEGARINRAREAAVAVKAVVMLKGADTVVAATDGRVAINVNAPPELATAGAGDVLSGIVGGLLATGADSFAAAAAGAWLHGEAASEFGGPGLIADDLPSLLPYALAKAFS